MTNQCLYSLRLLISNVLCFKAASIHEQNHTHYPQTIPTYYKQPPPLRIPRSLASKTEGESWKVWVRQGSPSPDGLVLQHPPFAGVPLTLLSDDH